MNSIVPAVQTAGVRIQSTLRGRAERWKSLLAREHTTDVASPQSRNRCLHSETSPYELFRDGLPLELWFLIVRHALEPRFAILHEFLSQDIHFFYLSLIIHHFSCPDRTELKRTRASLRLVCKNLNTIVQKITSNEDQNPPWIRSYSPNNALRYGPCARLDVGFRDLTDIAKINTQYPHDVGTLYLHFQQANDPLSAWSLSSLLANPWTLKVLHITLPGAINEGGRLPFNLLVELSSLEALSIAAQSPLKLYGVLPMPRLKTLFLTCIPAPRSYVTQWSFPKLKNLAIDTRGWPFSSAGDNFDALFKSLVDNHRHTIKSLRLIPMIQPTLTISGWMPLSHLEVLATDFVRYIYQDALDTQPWRNTVLHLTHISTHPYTWRQLTKALLETLNCFPSVRTLAITEDPFLQSKATQADGQDGDTVGVRKLEKLCRSRGIEIIGKIGNDVCCIMKVFQSLTIPQIQDT